MSKTVNNQVLGAWVLKCNPDVYDIFADIEQGKLPIDNWSVYPNYRSEMMAAGDPVVLWVSGKSQPGIWGIGKITGPTGSASELGIILNEETWKDKDELAKAKLFAQTNIEILSSPISKEALKQNSVFANCEIFTSPQMANPSFLNADEFAVLKDLVESKFLDDFDSEDISKYVDPEDFDELDFLKKIKNLAGKLPFSRDMLALYYASKDSEVSVAKKASILAGLAYFVLPTDAIPDVIVGFGYVDDAAAIMLLIKLLGNTITNQHREDAEKFFADDADN